MLLLLNMATLTCTTAIIKWPYTIKVFLLNRFIIHADIKVEMKPTQDIINAPSLGDKPDEPDFICDNISLESPPMTLIPVIS